MESKFKVGDGVEGTQDGRWIRGIVKSSYNSASGQWLAVEVLNTDESMNDLHLCNVNGVAHVPSGKGWNINSVNAKPSKNTSILEIINAL